MEHLRLFPRPRLALVAGELCRCRCHAIGPRAAAENEYDEYEEAVPRINGVGNRCVPLLDPVAAVQSCPECSGHHVGVFSGRPPELDRTRRQWNPKPLVAAQADGDVE